MRPKARVFPSRPRPASRSTDRIHISDFRNLRRTHLRSLAGPYIRVKLGRKFDVRGESAFPPITNIVDYSRALGRSRFALSASVRGSAIPDKLESDKGSSYAPDFKLRGDPDVAR